MTKSSDAWPPELQEARAKAEPFKPAPKPRDTKPMPTKRHKYGAAPKAERTFDGIVFDSKKEMEVYVGLKALERAGKISDLKRQPYFAWRNKHVARLIEDGPDVEIVGRAERYTADFSYVEYGVTVILDVKGYRTREYLKKKKIVEKLFGVKILEV